jgi:hypothetical protein
VLLSHQRRATSPLPKALSHRPTRRVGGVGCMGKRKIGSDPSRGAEGASSGGDPGSVQLPLSSPTKPRRRQPHALGSLEPSKLAQRIRRGNPSALDVDREGRHCSGYTEARVDGSMSPSASPVPKRCTIRLRQPLRGQVSRRVSWRRHVAEVCVSPRSLTTSAGCWREAALPVDLPLRLSCSMGCRSCS